MGIITKGMGAIMKSKMRKAFVDKPTFQDKLIDQLNKATEKQRKKFTTGDKITEEPKGLDFYTDIMVSDFEKKTGPYFEREKKRLKKLKGKK
jgi:hypothetical protein